MNKYILIALVLILLPSVPSVWADQKITELPANTAPSGDDLIVVVNDPGGTPATQRTTLQAVYALFKEAFDVVYLTVADTTGWDKDSSDDLADAPNDGTGYVRKSGAWAAESEGGGGLADAPSDGTEYLRKDGAWVNPTGTDATGMENPMEDEGDMIIGGTAGAPTALGKGADNTFLGIDGDGVLGWQSMFSLDDSAAQFKNATDTTKQAKILCSGITAGQTRVMTWPDFNFTPAVLGSNLVPASSYYNFGTVAGSTGYGLRDNAGAMEYKNSDGDWEGIGSGGGGTSAGAQYDIQIADDASGFAAVTGEFKYQSNTLYVGTGGLSQAKTSGTAGVFTLYSNNSTDTTGAGLKGPSATLANSYYLIFPSAEPAATAIWAHAAASSHNSAGSWLYVGTGASNIPQLDGSGKLSTDVIPTTASDSETIYDADGGTVSVAKTNAVVILGATGTVNPITPALGVFLMSQNLPGTTGQITINCPTGCYLGKADGSGYLNQNQDYQSGGAYTDRIVYAAIDSTHYVCITATGTWTGL